MKRVFFPSHLASEEGFGFKGLGLLTLEHLFASITGFRYAKTPAIMDLFDKQMT